MSRRREGRNCGRSTRLCIWTRCWRRSPTLSLPRPARLRTCSKRRLLPHKPPNRHQGPCFKKTETSAAPPTSATLPRPSSLPTLFSPLATSTRLSFLRLERTRRPQVLSDNMPLHVDYLALDRGLAKPTVGLVSVAPAEGEVVSPLRLRGFVPRHDDAEDLDWREIVTGLHVLHECRDLVLVYLGHDRAVDDAEGYHMHPPLAIHEHGCVRERHSAHGRTRGPYTIRTTAAPAGAAHRYTGSHSCGLSGRCGGCGCMQMQCRDWRYRGVRVVRGYLTVGATRASWDVGEIRGRTRVENKTDLGGALTWAGTRTLFVSCRQPRARALLAFSSWLVCEAPLHRSSPALRNHNPAALRAIPGAQFHQAAAQAITLALPHCLR